MDVIRHKTFSQRKGLTAKTILEVQEQVRAQAEAFVAGELRPEDVINVTESTMALPLTSWNLFSVTVWYKRSQ